MAHEVEKMLYVGSAPWHGLGTRFIEAPPLSEAIVAAGLDWKVGTKPLFTADGTPVPAKATIRESDNSILGVVGPTYKPLQNLEAFNFFAPFIDQKLATIETAGSLREGKRVFILAKLALDPTTIVKGDDIEKYVLLSNSHDGTLAVRVGFTPIRVVCNNTLQIAHNDQASKLIRVRHSGNIVQNLENLREVMNLANQQFEASAEQYRFLATKQINSLDLAKYVKLIFADPKSENGGERVLAQIIPLFEKGRGNDMIGVKGSMWAAYNAVSEYLQYERGTDSHNRLDSMWFGNSASLNKKALDIAIMMAA
jgi:phage/plasmid-like protein (TIGR03299 family)